MNDLFRATEALTRAGEIGPLEKQRVGECPRDSGLGHFIVVAARSREHQRRLFQVVVSVVERELILWQPPGVRLLWQVECLETSRTNGCKGEVRYSQ
jgi:hypothetical protein